MSFIMPGRRSTTNLIQASGELWDDEEQEAPLQIVVLVGGPAIEPRVAAIIRALIQLAPDDVTLDPVSIDDLPPFDPVADGNVAVAGSVVSFRDAVGVADGFILIVPSGDGPALESLIGALHWAATPTGEDALAGLPVVVLAVGGDVGATAVTNDRVHAAVDTGGGVAPLGIIALAAPLAGSWRDRLGPDGQLRDIATRQAIGHILIRLREIVLASGVRDSFDDEDRPGTDGPEV